jgi:hypothetical protein
MQASAYDDWTLLTAAWPQFISRALSFQADNRP